MKTREQNRNNKRTERERLDWFIERTQTRVAFGWFSEGSAQKTSCPKNNTTQRHDWPIEQYLHHIRVSFGGKTKSPCFDLFIYWLIKQTLNTYRNHFQGHTKIVLTLSILWKHKPDSERRLQHCYKSGHKEYGAQDLAYSECVIGKTHWAAYKKRNC